MEKESTETSKLYEEFKRLKPEYADKASAIAATLAQLEKIAASSGLPIDAYLMAAHSSANSSSEQLLALQLERQLNFLRR